MMASSSLQRSKELSKLTKEVIEEISREGSFIHQRNEEIRRHRNDTPRRHVSKKVAFGNVLGTSIITFSDSQSAVDSPKSGRKDPWQFSCLTSNPFSGCASNVEQIVDDADHDSFAMSLTTSSDTSTMEQQGFNLKSFYDQLWHQEESTGNDDDDDDDTLVATTFEEDGTTISSTSTVSCSLSR